MKFKAIHFVQHETEMYNCVISAGDLVKSGKVDIWKPNHEEGYQREPEPSRAKAYSRYISAEISPPAILANIRTSDKEKVRYNNGWLEIPDDVPLWLEDGQHRVGGLKLLMESAPEKFVDLPIPIVITMGLSVYEEAKQFLVVNKTQKKVRTDLAERFLQKAEKEEGVKNLYNRGFLRGIEWIPTAIAIADTLNRDDHSTWHDKIRLPNEPKGVTVVNQKSFTDSLKPLVHADGVLAGKSPAVIASILNRYWEAIRELNPKPFDEPENYVIQTTTGVFVLHSLMTKVCMKVGKDEPQKKDFLNVLGRIESLKDEGKWSKNGEYGNMAGQKGFNLIKWELQNELESAYQNAVVQ
ncbi:MAG: DGQHR domain-containing protein [Thaumarchaeota archaeon]|nr:DGQHR domain-containing protein [Nitrososphaerota archaeon]